MMSKAPEKQMLAWLAQPHIRPYFIALLSTLLIFLQSYVDPFGLVSAADKSSSLLYSKIISPFYGGQQHKGRDNILVVLYDKAYFNVNNKADKQSSHWSVWPLPPKRHERLIEKIAGANPSAIFLDVYFSIDNHEREKNIADFYSELNDLDCNDAMNKADCEDESLVPIFLAGVLSDPHPKALDKSPPRSTLAEQPVLPFFYQLQVCDRNDRGECISKPVNTAAYDLYQHWCARQNWHVPSSCEQVTSSNSNKTMFLQWGYAPSEAMLAIVQAGRAPMARAAATINNNPTKPKLSISSECQVNTQGFTALLEVFKLTMRGILDYKEKKPLCTYHDALSAHMIQQMSFNDLSDAVKDKVVLIGATDYPLADVIESYVHDYIPGVFWHAAALDNLIESPNHFSRNLAKNINLGLEVMAALLLYFFMALFIGQNRLTQERLKKWKVIDELVAKKQQQLMINVQLLTIFISICLLSIVLNLVWVGRSYAPENWISTAGLLFLLCSDQFITANSFFSRLSQSFANYTAQPLAAMLQKSDFLAHRYLGRFNPYPTSSFFLYCLMWLERVLTYLITWLLFVSCFFALGFFVCFVPVVYFTVNKTSSIELYSFALVYMTFILVALVYWRHFTLKLRRSESEDKYLFFIKRKLLK